MLKLEPRQMPVASGRDGLISVLLQFYTIFGKLNQHGIISRERGHTTFIKSLKKRGYLSAFSFPQISRILFLFLNSTCTKRVSWMLHWEHPLFVDGLLFVCRQFLGQAPNLLRTKPPFGRKLGVSSVSLGSNSCGFFQATLTRENSKKREYLINT